VMMYLTSLVAGKYGLRDIFLRKVAARVKTWLKPGGRVFVQMHAIKEDVLHDPEYDTLLHDIAIHMEGYSACTLTQVLGAFSAEGFQIVSCEEHRKDVQRFFFGSFHRLARLDKELWNVQPDRKVWTSLADYVTMFRRGVLDSLTGYRIVLTC
jgi:hypothetical protein